MSELPRAASESDKLIGEVLANRYAIESRLGEGAMGTVYKAKHVKVGRPFAVKVLHPRLLNEEKLVMRFAREAELAGKLHHPNVIGVVDVGETPDGMHYMVMDFVAGPDLATLLADAPLAPARVISLVRQLCDGLQHAHDVGLIHRDFKPENVIVETDSAGTEIPRIVDFGIAILQDAGDSTSSDGRLTTNGLVLGTPHYMAPEQAVADPIDHRIDLFALGIIMYEMLTGRLPFDGSGAEVARANLVLDPPMMAKRVPHLEVDPLLEALTRKLMAKNRDARPQTGKATRELLDLIVHDRAAAAVALGVPLDQARTPMTTESVRNLYGADGSAAPAAPVAHSGVTNLDAPPMLAPTAAALNDRDPRRTSMATPLPWSDSSRRRGFVIAGVAGVAVLAGALAIALHGGSKQPAATTGSNAAVAIAPAAPITPTTPVGDPAQPIDPTAGSGSAVGSAATPIVTPIVTPTSPTLGDPKHAPQTPTHPKIATAPLHAPATHPSDLIVDPPMTPDKPATPVVKPPTPHIVDTQPAVAASSGALTTKELVQQYASVGSALKALEDKHGPDATADLWPRYRLIQISSAMSSPEKRADAATILSRLRRDIATRNK